MTSIEGEATANNRKAKLIFFYEWVIKGEWSGGYLYKLSGVMSKYVFRVFLPGPTQTGL